MFPIGITPGRLVGGACPSICGGKDWAQKRWAIKKFGSFFLAPLAAPSPWAWDLSACKRWKIHLCPSSHLHSYLLGPRSERSQVNLKWSSLKSTWASTIGGKPACMKNPLACNLYFTWILPPHKYMYFITQPGFLWWNHLWVDRIGTAGSVVPFPLGGSPRGPSWVLACTWAQRTKEAPLKWTFHPLSQLRSEYHKYHITLPQTVELLSQHSSYSAHCGSYSDPEQPSLLVSQPWSKLVFQVEQSFGLSLSLNCQHHGLQKQGGLQV